MNFMIKQYTHQTAVAGIDFTFTIELAKDIPLEINTSVESIEGDQDTVLLHLVIKQPHHIVFTLRSLSIRWQVPVVDMHGFYAGPPSPEELASVPYWRVHKQVSANMGVPFVSLFHRNSENRAAFGLLDQLTETTLDGELSEISRCYHFHWRKSISKEILSIKGSWTETLFISVAHRPWPEIVSLYRQTIDQTWAQPKMPVPAHAYDPVFSTWTAIHHHVDQEWILRHARLAADLGFGIWITDDGWFSEKSVFADYRYTGDWQPCQTKFPDFLEHVQAVQELGLRYLLWVAPFMLGHNSQAMTRYAHLISHELDNLNASNLSPQQSETGEIILDLLIRLVNDYHLDGLKLDFLDAIKPDGESSVDTIGHRQGENIYHILSQVVDRLTALRPDLLIEFRNTYANLASRRYSNLYRASDVPLNFAMNRWQVVTLRLLAPDRAVHFDPALWHPDDTAENVAVHLINAIISVPVVSIELDRYPASHLALIRYWIGFYKEHRDTIIHGEIIPNFHLGRIPLIRFEGDHECIIGLYDDVAFALSLSHTSLWILNASSRPQVELLPNHFKGPRTIITRNKFGDVTNKAIVNFPISHLMVEVGGSIEILSK